MVRKLIILFLILTYNVCGATYYLATDGDDSTGDGSISSPWATGPHALRQMVGGDTLYVRGGTYSCDSTWNLTADHEGTASDRTAILGYPGETVILDFSGFDATPSGGDNAYGQAIQLWITGFITIKDLTIRNLKQVDNYEELTAVSAYRSHNDTYENIVVHDIGGRGFFKETPWGFGTDPSYDTTRYINCDAYNCADSLPYTTSAVGQEGNQADGFKEYGEKGTVFYYTNCRAWNCSDDGWDTGTGGKLYLTNCWSFNNGWNLLGDGDGFKLAGHTDTTLYLADTVLRYVSNCISAYNQLRGYFFLEYEDYFRSNGRFWNNIAYENTGSQGAFSNNALSGRENIEWQLFNCIFYATGAYPHPDSGTLVSAPYKQYTESNNNWDDVTGFPGWQYTDTVAFSPSSDWEVSDSATVFQQLSAARESDGSLPTITAFKPVEGSDLIDAGRIDIPDFGNITGYSGAAPDIGAFEYSPAALTPSISGSVRPASGSPTKAFIINGRPQRIAIE